MQKSLLQDQGSSWASLCHLACSPADALNHCLIKVDATFLNNFNNRALPNKSGKTAGREGQFRIGIFIIHPHWYELIWRHIDMSLELTFPLIIKKNFELKKYLSPSHYCALLNNIFGFGSVPTDYIAGLQSGPTVAETMWVIISFPR